MVFYRPRLCRNFMYLIRVSMLFLVGSCLLSVFLSISTVNAQTDASNENLTDVNDLIDQDNFTLFNTTMLFKVSSNFFSASFEQQTSFVETFANSYNKGNIFNASSCDPYTRIALNGTFDIPQNPAIISTNAQSENEDERRDLLVDVPGTNLSDVPFDFDFMDLTVKITGACQDCPADPLLFENDVSNRRVLVDLEFINNTSDCDPVGPTEQAILEIFQEDLLTTLPGITCKNFTEVNDEDIPAIGFQLVIEEAPTVVLTDEPTNKPTDPPTNEPTHEPTDEPTESPSCTSESCPYGTFCNYEPGPFKGECIECLEDEDCYIKGDNYCSLGCDSDTGMCEWKKDCCAYDYECDSGEFCASNDDCIHHKCVKECDGDWYCDYNEVCNCKKGKCEAKDNDDISPSPSYDDDYSSYDDDFG